MAKKLGKILIKVFGYLNRFGFVNIWHEISHKKMSPADIFVSIFFCVLIVLSNIKLIYKCHSNLKKKLCITCKMI